jgi:acetoin utilization deacetylase AcuC-like enzyme
LFFALSAFVFYSPDYFLPLPVGHPFPMEKFPQAYEALVREGWLEESMLQMVDPCPEEALRRVHTAEYLHRIAAGTLPEKEARALGLPPGEPLLRRSALETEGTVRACRAALTQGLGLNLAGGTHHAFPDRGEGFCVLNDVAVAVRALQAEHGRLRIFVADTDAHQGNGTHAILGSDATVFTYSIHVGANYPSRKVTGSLDVPLPRFVQGKEYLTALRATLRPSLWEFAPDLLIWVSGVDPHANDRFGQMQLRLRDLQERDRLVVEWARERSCPLAVLYGGGYSRQPGDTARMHRNTVVTALRAWHFQPTPQRKLLETPRDTSPAMGQ